MTDIQVEIINGPIRSRYPWKSLLTVGSSFTIPAENKAGVVNSRQLCYAANKAAERKGSEIRYKSIKQKDGSVVICRVA